MQSTSSLLTDSSSNQNENALVTLHKQFPAGFHAVRTLNPDLGKELEAIALNKTSTDITLAHRPSRTLYQPYFLIVTLLLLASVACLAGGCNSRSVGTSSSQHPIIPSEDSIHLIGSADTSGGFVPHLPEAVELLLQLIEQLSPDSDQLTVFSTDWNSAEVYDGPVPESTEALQETLTHAFAASPTRNGTRPEQFFESAISRASSGPSVILYCTDGDSDEPALQRDATLQNIGGRLAENANIKSVVVVGITPGNRAFWRRDFAALDASGRLALLTLDPETADRVSKLIQAAR